MTATRWMPFCMLLTLATQAATAQEPGNVIFHAAPDMPGAGALPLLAWGPGTMAFSPAVMGRLFPPTLIMQRQKELALTERQQETIKSELRDFQSRVVDVQWDLQSSQGALESVLESDRIDPEAAAAAIDQLLTAENALKKLHLNLLVRIRNALEPEQISKLENALRVSHRSWTMPLPPPPPAP